MRVRFAEGLATPLTWGILRPLVVLPREAATEWSEERRRAALLHELAHVRRLDTLTQLLAEVACAVHWMNPLAWHAARRMRHERERACDDRALTAGKAVAPAAYAEALVETARSVRRQRLLEAGGAVAMASASPVGERVEAALDESAERGAVGPSLAALCAALAGVLVLLTGAFHPRLGSAPADDGSDDVRRAYRPALAEAQLRKVAETPLRPRRFGAAVAAGDTAVYAAGGHARRVGPVGMLLRIDPETGEHETLTDALVPRRWHGAAFHEGTVYVAGGVTRKGQRMEPTLAVEAYDLDTGQVRTVARLPAPQVMAGVVVTGGKLYVIGGREQDANGSGKRWLRRVSIYDIAAGEWSQGAKMPTAREAEAFLHEGKIWMTGGFNGETALKTVEVYDPEADAWSEAPPLPARTSAHAPAVVGDVAYLFGHYDEEGRMLAYSLEDGQARRLEESGFAPGRHARAAALGSRVVVFGGNGTSSSGRFWYRAPGVQVFRASGKAGGRLRAASRQQDITSASKTSGEEDLRLLDVTNGSFEDASSGDASTPAEWYTGGDGYEATLTGAAAAPREGERSLRLRSDPSFEGQRRFGVATQSVAAGAAKGHRARLSGWIKTEAVGSGYAGLWLRVDGARRQIALDNMKEGDRAGQGPPTGTTEWTRFAVEVGVPPEAEQLVFGALMPGEGTAWFDGLEIRFDENTQVASSSRSANTSVTRPDYPERLLTGEALRPDSTEGTPDVENAKAEQWVSAQAREVRSLVSDNYDDLRFLEEVLDGKRIVQLGESSHGVAEFNLAKVRLIKYLHEELDYDVIALESSLYECYRADQAAAGQPPEATMRDCIFGVWHTEEVLRLFDYIRQTRQAGGDPLRLAGFDVQESSYRGKQGRPAFLRDVVAAADPAYAREVSRLDSAFAGRQQGFGEAESRREARAAYYRENGERLAAAYDQLAAFLDEHIGELQDAFSEDPAKPLVARQTARSLATFVRQGIARHAEGGEAGGLEGSETRDRGMARNLRFLAEELYPGEKIITWGHNFHLRHANAAMPGQETRTMGRWAKDTFGDAMYTVGFYMYRGHTAMNDRTVVPVRRPGPGSLEALLAAQQRKYLFLNLDAGSDAEWLSRPITAQSWGRRPLTMRLGEQYDGIFFVYTTHPPRYL